MANRKGGIDSSVPSSRCSISNPLRFRNSDFPTTTYLFASLYCIPEKSKNMGSEVGTDADPWDDFQLDPVSEAELQAIETSYFSSSKRSFSGSLSHPDSYNKPKSRRLPNWSLQSGRTSSRTPSSSDAIWNIAPAPCRANHRTKYQAMKFMGRIDYCRTTNEVERASMELLDKIKAKNGLGQVPLGFDIEWRPSFRQGETPRKAAVMQICMDTTCCYVMHIIHSGIPPVLKSLLEDSSSIKVGKVFSNHVITKGAFGSLENKMKISYLE